MRDTLYIDGGWHAASGGPIQVFNPASEEVIWEMAGGTAADIDRAVTAAKRAFASWRRTSGDERAAFLSAIAGRVRERREELIRLSSLKNRKPRAEAAVDMGRRRGRRLLRRSRDLGARQEADVPIGSALWREEIFGPVLAVRTFGSEREAIGLANDSDFGLVAMVVTVDEARPLGPPGFSGGEARHRLDGLVTGRPERLAEE